MNSSQNNNYFDGEGSKTSFASFSSPLKEKFFIYNISVHHFTLIRWRTSVLMAISCRHKEAEVYTEKSCDFLSPFEVKLKSITACLYGQESDCVFWHLNARLVGNFPLNPFIAQIPVERTYISAAAGLPYGVCLRYLRRLCRSVYPSEAMPFHVLLFGCVQHIFKMKYWPKPLWMAVRS